MESFVVVVGVVLNTDEVKVKVKGRTRQLGLLVAVVRGRVDGGYKGEWKAKSMGWDGKARTKSTFDRLLVYKVMGINQELNRVVASGSG